MFAHITDSVVFCVVLSCGCILVVAFASCVHAFVFCFFFLLEFRLGSVIIFVFACCCCVLCLLRLWYVRLFCFRPCVLLMLSLLVYMLPIPLWFVFLQCLFPFKVGLVCDVCYYFVLCLYYVCCFCFLCVHVLLLFPGLLLLLLFFVLYVFVLGLLHV